MLKTFQLATLLFFMTTCLYFNKTVDLSKENEVLRHNTKKTIKALKSDRIDLSQRLTVYYLITLEQNNILEKFQSSRNEKRNNKKITELMQKLN